MSRTYQKTFVNRGIKKLNETIVPAPIGGLNASSSFENMNMNEAIEMDNYIPKNNCVSLRRGYKKHASLPFIPKTLFVYKSKTQKDRFFAMGGNQICEISQKGDYRNPSLEYYNKMAHISAQNFGFDEWQWVQFKDRIFLVNGVDSAQTYIPDETEETFGKLEEVSFTGEGLNLLKLVNTFVSKQRLWFIEKNSLRVWYTKGAGEVQGELIPFDMSSVASFGGTLIAGASWTQDGGSGMDDLTVFITSEGEVLVYKGNDPNDATSWTLKGVYKMAEPLGYRCFIKYHGDLVLISKQGYVPLSKALPLEGANASLLAFSSKISDLVVERANLYQNKKGWQGLLYPRGGYALFNVPISRGFEQHICNTSTGAWARFRGIKSYTWELFLNRLYFASDNAVYLFDEGYMDDLNPIVGKIAQAYTSFSSSKFKRVLLLKPLLKSTKPFALQIYTNTDFDGKKQPYTTWIGSAGESYWNELKWSTLKAIPSSEGTSHAKWATLQGVKKSEWISNLSSGVYFSLILQTNTKGCGIDFFSTGVKYEIAN